MSRRDTIIVAVLVNAALLMILFATAIRSPKEDIPLNPKNAETKITDLAQAFPPSASEDILSEYVTTVPTFAESGSENIFPFEETPFPLSSASATAGASSPVLPQYKSEEMKIPKSKAENQTVNITVKKGDFLEKIAKANNTTVAVIMKTNNLTSTQLKIGQVLKIPLTEEKNSEKRASSLPSSEGEYYIVKEGDNPWTIATRNKINLDELLRLNGLDEQKAKRLKPGDKLKIR